MARSEQWKARNALAQRKRRRWLKSHGFCCECGSAWVVPGHVRCPACAEKATAYQRRFDPDGAKARERSKRRRDEREAAGVCKDCGAPLEDKRFKNCEACRAKRRDWMRVYAIKQRFEREAQEARERSRR